MGVSAEVIEEIQRSVRRTAAVGHTVGGLPDANWVRSCLGRVSAIGRSETWPTFDGRPMAALAQLNLTESRWIPPELAGIALINLWLAEDGGELVLPDDRPNGDGWELRAYASLDELTQVDGMVLEWIQPRQLDWEIVDDYPDWEDLAETIESDEVLRDLSDDVEDLIGAAASGTKLGGWPTLIQSSISWAPWNQHPASPTYCLQVDSEESVNLNLWDSGVLHVGLGSIDGQPIWVTETQFM